MIYAITLLAISILIAALWILSLHGINRGLRHDIKYKNELRDKLVAEGNDLRKSNAELRERLQVAEGNADSMALTFGMVVGELERKPVINRLPLRFVGMIRSANSALNRHVEGIRARKQKVEPLHAAIARASKIRVTNQEINVMNPNNP